MAGYRGRSGELDVAFAMFSALIGLWEMNSVDHKDI
jgi:hypothetical protein